MQEVCESISGLELRILAQPRVRLGPCTCNWGSNGFGLGWWGRV